MFPKTSLLLASTTASVLGLLSPTAFAAVVIDDFGDTSLAEYTLTRVNDTSVATQNLTFSSPSGSLVATYTGTSAAEQVLLLRGDYSLAIGEMLRADAVITSTTTLDIGIAIAATATPIGSTNPSPTDTRTLTDFFSMSVRVNGSGGFIRANSSISGTLVTADLNPGFVQPLTIATISQLFIERVSATEYNAGYFDTSNTKFVARTVNFAPTSTVGSAVGIYADLRAAGTLSGLDNLTLVPEPSAALLGALGALGILRRRRA